MGVNPKRKIVRSLLKTDLRSLRIYPFQKVFRHRLENTKVVSLVEMAKNHPAVGCSSYRNTVLSFLFSAHSDSCIQRVFHCLSHVPCASLIAWILLILGLGGVTGSLLFGSRKTRDLLEDEET